MRLLRYISTCFDFVAFYHTTVWSGRFVPQKRDIKWFPKQSLVVPLPTSAKDSISKGLPRSLQPTGERAYLVWERLKIRRVSGRSAAANFNTALLNQGRSQAALNFVWILLRLEDRWLNTGSLVLNYIYFSSVTLTVSLWHWSKTLRAKTVHTIYTRQCCWFSTWSK